MSKTDYRVLSFLIKKKYQFFTTAEIKGILDVDLSTVQRAVKKMYEKNVLKRMQNNLSGGGYTFKYSIKSMKEIKEVVMLIVKNWTDRVESEMEKWD